MESWRPIAPAFAYPQPNEWSNAKLTAAWLGHSTVLINFFGVMILTDPVLFPRIGIRIPPLFTIGPKRLTKPALKFKELPPIDLVLLSHAHFDHLDRRTLRRIAADQPIVVPIGVGNLVHDLGFNIVHELDHWQRVELGSLCVSLTPCHHWGARMLHDSHRGFGGFVIESEGRSIFHCGDSAYFDGFAEIGKRFDIEIALLPIGAYDPPSGREVHMNPEEAVRAFMELRARKLVPMHYGSFRLGYEPLDEPPARLLASARTHGIEGKVVVMTEGVPVVL